MQKSEPSWLAFSPNSTDFQGVLNEPQKNRKAVLCGQRPYHNMLLKISTQNIEVGKR